MPLPKRAQDRKDRALGHAQAGLQGGEASRGDLRLQQVRTNHGELVHELERRLGVQDSIIKYQTIRLDEELKRQKKLTHKREQRAARRPRRVTQHRFPRPQPNNPPARLVLVGRVYAALFLVPSNIRPAL